MYARSWPFFFWKRDSAMRNRLWFFRIIPRNRPDDPRYSFCFCPRLYVGCICPFFQTAIFPVAFFRPESRYFFSVESTPENSRRHLVAELLITASLRASCPILCPSFPIFFLFSGLEFRRTYVRTYGSCNRRIPRARLLGTNERNAAVCTVSSGERRRVASHCIASAKREGEEGYTGLHRRGNATARTLEDHPARQYEITFVR